MAVEKREETHHADSFLNFDTAAGLAWLRLCVVPHGVTYTRTIFVVISYTHVWRGSTNCLQVHGACFCFRCLTPCVVCVLALRSTPLVCLIDTRFIPIFPLTVARRIYPRIIATYTTSTTTARSSTRSSRCTAVAGWMTLKKGFPSVPKRSTGGDDDHHAPAV